MQDQLIPAIIKRIHYTVSQTKLGSTEQRMVNFNGAFTTNKSLENQHILLVNNTQWQQGQLFPTVEKYWEKTVQHWFPWSHALTQGKILSND